jgi:hypothetical protein
MKASKGFYTLWGLFIFSTPAAPIRFLPVPAH